MDDFENNRTRQLRHYDTPRVSESEFEPCCPRCFSSLLVEPEQRVIDGEHYHLIRHRTGPILTHASQQLWWCGGCGYAFDKGEAVGLRALTPVEPPVFFDVQCLPYKYVWL